MDKKKIRKELIARRRNIFPLKKEEYDSCISKKIIELDEFKNARDILLFAPLQDEFNTTEIAKFAIDNHKNLYFPKCINDNGEMNFFKIKTKDDFRKGMYGIYEPKYNLPLYSNTKDSICIVPALSVDEDFYRIGYGKGYYDRFLKSFYGISICPIYSELTTKSLPKNEFDIKIDIIVTERNTRRS